MGWFEPVNRNSYSVRAKIIAEHSRISVDSRISIRVNSQEIGDTNLIFFSVGCCCKNAARMTVLEASFII